MDILKILKNKNDFKSVILQASTGQIFIEYKKRYFETVKRYNITIDHHNGERVSKLNQTGEQITNILKNYNIIKITQ